MTESSMAYPQSVRSYSGNGILSFDSGSSHECEFEATQFENGSIQMNCKTQNDSSPNLLESHEFVGANAAFTGKTDSGKPVRVSHLFCIRSNYPLISQTEKKVELSFILNGPACFEVGSIDEVQKGEARFFITNLDSVGTHSQDDRNQRKLCASFEFAEKTITLYPTSDSREALESLKRFGGVRVTSEAVTAINGNTDFENVSRLMKIFCLLLTIARGTYVSWLYVDVFVDDTCVYSAHHHAITYPYSAGLPVIQPAKREATKDFLEKGLERYLALERDYNLYGLINNYSMGRTNTFLEARAFSLITSVEFLAGRHAKLTGKEWIIDKKQFERQLESLRKEVKQMLKQLFSGIANSDQRRDMVSGLMQLNRPMFETNLIRLCSEFKVPLHKDEKGEYVEIRAFVKSRNELIHAASFRSDNPVDEYFSMIHLVDKIILRLLGYTGPYFNVAILGDDILEAAE